MFLPMLRVATLALTFAGAAQAAEVSVYPVEITDYKSVFGQVQSRDVTPARARIGGTLLNRAVEEGSSVKAGDVIAVIGDEKLGLQLQAVEAQIKGVSSQLANARTEFERAQSLMPRGFTTKAAFDQAKTNVDVLTHQLEAAKAQRAVVVQQSSEGQVIAPKAGRVLTTPVIPGAVVMPGETVARIAAGAFFIRLSLPERHAAVLSAGTPVTVGARGLDPSKSMNEDNLRKGKIIKVYPELESGRVTADAEVENLGDFFVGERVQALIPVAKRKTFVAPAAAVSTRVGVDYVRILRNGAPYDVAVIVAPLMNGDSKNVEVLSGLLEGDKVVTP